MLTERDISARLGRPVASPIRLGRLGDLGIDEAHLLRHLGPYFEGLADDTYLRRHSQLAALSAALPHDGAYLDELTRESPPDTLAPRLLAPLLDRLDDRQRRRFTIASLVTRQRSIAQFSLSRSLDQWHVERVAHGGFRQNVPDARSRIRRFSEAHADCVGAPIFISWMVAVAELVRAIHPNARRLSLTVHLVRSLPYAERLADNSPEGVHEDGAHYIVSALVIARANLVGAASEVYEAHDDGTRELLLRRVLQVGEFLFQADTGEERTFGNDLWHSVTPMVRKDPRRPAHRDIVGIDVDIVG